MIEKEDDIKSLLLLSKDISNEASQVLYRENLFEYHVCRPLCFIAPLREPLFDFPIEHQQRIRRVRFVVNGESVKYVPCGAKNVFCSPILARLTTLELVLLGPLDERFDNHGNRLESQPWLSRLEIDRLRISKKAWFQWLTPWLQYIAKTTPPDLNVSVDDGGNVESGLVVENVSRVVSGNSKRSEAINIMDDISSEKMSSLATIAIEATHSTSTTTDRTTFM